LRSSLKVAILVICGVVTAAPQASSDQAERQKITIGVGGKPLLYYLPLTIAEQKGFFKEEGLDVTIDELGGGSTSLKALIGGSVDAVAGAYEHTILMQAKGQDITAVIEFDRFPGLALVVQKKEAAKYKSVKDLKGAKIGVTAPGSSSNFFVDFLLEKSGLTAADVSFVGVGGGATSVAQMKHGGLDAMANVDPVITKLEGDGDTVTLADTRNEKSSMDIFGGQDPGGVVYLKTDFVKQNPVTVQKLTNAFYKALKWLQTAAPEQIADTVPQDYLLGDKALYLAAVRNSKPIYSVDGVIPKSGMSNALNILVRFSPEMKGVNIDLAKTFDDRFVKRSAETIK
jgi:NitT/TauT family transport system substrate-binding protein